MATDTAKNPITWLKNLGIAAVAVIVVSFIIRMGLDAWSDSSTSNNTNQPANQSSSVSINGKPAGQKWDPYDEVDTCFVRWNAQESGPWCEAMVLPPGTYRIIPRFTEMWQHANVSRNGVLGYHNIPARGIMLSDIFDPIDRSYREFLQMAPLGGNMWFGRLVARVGDKLMYDPYEHGGFTITEPTKVLVGINIPPRERYVAMDTGKLPFDVERLRQ